MQEQRDAAGSHPIEQLLAEVRGMVSPPAWRRVEELIRAVLDLHREGFERIMARVEANEAGGAEIRGRLLKDELVSALLLLHDLHPEALEARTEVRDPAPQRGAGPESADGSVHWVGLDAPPAQGRRIP